MCIRTSVFAPLSGVLVFFAWQIVSEMSFECSVENVKEFLKSM